MSTAPHDKPTVAKNAAVQTWYKTALEGTQIFPIQVVKVNPTTLVILTDTGAQDTVQREDPAVRYWPTYQEAGNAVEKRLREGVLTMTCRLDDFLNGRTLCGSPHREIHSKG